jgi:hypothetical protein
VLASRQGASANSTTAALDGVNEESHDMRR